MILKTESYASAWPTMHKWHQNVQTFSSLQNVEDVGYALQFNESTLSNCDKVTKAVRTASRKKSVAQLQSQTNPSKLRFSVANKPLRWNNCTTQQVGPFELRQQKQSCNNSINIKKLSAPPLQSQTNPGKCTDLV